MTQPTRIRAAAKDGITEVIMLMAHAMETGQRKDSSGNLIPAHYITEVTVRHAERVVLNAQLSGSVSANPYVAFKFTGGARGEKVVVSWTDNQGVSRSDEVEIA